MLTIKYQTAFRKDYKRAVRRGCHMHLPEQVITFLAEERQLPAEYRDHALSGDDTFRFTPRTLGLPGSHAHDALVGISPINKVFPLVITNRRCPHTFAVLRLAE